MNEEVGEYDTPLNKARPVGKPKVMIAAEKTFKKPSPCTICEYSDRCFWPLKWFFSRYCQQSRKRKEYRQKQTTLPIPEDTEVELSCG